MDSISKNNNQVKYSEINRLLFDHGWSYAAEHMDVRERRLSHGWSYAAEHMDVRERRLSHGWSYAAEHTDVREWRLIKKSNFRRGHHFGFISLFIIGNLHMPCPYLYGVVSSYKYSTINVDQ